MEGSTTLRTDITHRNGQAGYNWSFHAAVWVLLPSHIGTSTIMEDQIICCFYIHILSYLTTNVWRRHVRGGNDVDIAFLHIYGNVSACLNAELESSVSRFGLK